MNRCYGQEPDSRKPAIRLMCWMAMGVVLVGSDALASRVTAGLVHRGDPPDWQSSTAPIPQKAPQDLTTINQLIGQLGDPEFFVRESAEKRLLIIGRLAIDPVRESRFAKNNEVRLRSRRLLTKLLRNDFQVQINDFLKDETNSVSLPAWLPFSQVAGIGKNTKELFAALYANSPELFQAMAENDIQSAAVHYQRLLKQVTSAQFRSVGVCSILFADTFEFKTDSKKQTSAQNTERVSWRSPAELARTSTRLTNSYVVSFANASGFKSEFDAILAQWIQQLPAGEPSLRNSRLRIIEKYELVALTPLLVEIFEDPTEPIHSRARAVSILAKLGNKTSVESLQPMLDDKQVVGHFKNDDADGKLLEVQFRDIALAASIFLSKQSIEKYGFLIAPDQNGRFIPLSQAGFSSAPVREKAFEKWHQFHQEHHDGSD